MPFRSSVKELEDYIGQTGTIRVHDAHRRVPPLQFPVEVLDVKRSYGRLRFLVRPVDKAKRDLGSRWVREDFITLDV